MCEEGHFPMLINILQNFGKSKIYLSLENSDRSLLILRMNYGIKKSRVTKKDDPNLPLTVRLK